MPSGHNVSTQPDELTTPLRPGIGRANHIRIPEGMDAGSVTLKFDGLFDRSNISTIMASV